MAEPDDPGGSSGTPKKPLHEKKEALDSVGRQFEALDAVPGAGGERLGEALLGEQRRPEGGSQPQASGPAGRRGLDAVTRNIRFAEALAAERRPLDIGTQARLEGMLGRKVGDANIYVGKYAGAAAKALQAEAFAVGTHVFVQEEKFVPGSAEGLGLLAHELTHTLQDPGSSVEEKEAQAHAMEDRVVQGVRTGDDMEFAQDQASTDSLLAQMGSPSEPAPTAAAFAKTPDQDTDGAETALAPDDNEAERLLLERVLERLRERWALELERFGQ